MVLALPRGGVPADDEVRTLLRKAREMEAKRWKVA
jgi:hypothetical protein